ncbi:MAG: efflux RND transporter permease subunit, partial [Tumebacillaceae bacterium]
NLTLDKVKQTLIANNISAPTGDVTLGDKTMNVQVGKLLTSVDDVKNVNLILIEQNTSGMSDAFKSIGASMGQLGQAVGGLGQSVGGLAKGQALMEQQLQLMGALNQLSAQMMQDQAQLKMLQANPAAAKDPATAAQIKQLTAKIGGEQAKITALQGNLTQIQNALKATGAENQQHLQRLQGGSAPPSTPNSGSTTPSLSVTSLKLSEIADVTYGTTKEGNYTRLNGKPAVVIGIEPSIGANTVDVVKQVQVKLNAFKLPKGYTLTTLRDQSVEIEKSVYAMLREAAFGALLAAIVTLLFLRNLRTTIVALLSIPLSILITMIVMNFMDYSLNMMTLAGVAVAVGRVVDDSIVVIENIYRRIQLSTPEERDTNFVVSATREVSQAITSSTVTTIGVFAPLAFVPGIVGKFFAPFAWSVVIALAFSLLIAITVVPMMSRLFLMRLKPVEHRENALQRVYTRLLHWSLGHKLIVIGLCVLLLVGTGLLTPKIPVNFFPAEKAKYYTLNVDMPIGTSLAKSNDVAMRVEQIIGDSKAAQNYNTTVSPGQVAVQITLKDTADPVTFETTMRDKTKNLGTGIKTALNAQGMSPGGGGLVMIINGPDLDTIKQTAQDMQKVIEGVPGVADVQSNIQGVQPQVTIAVDDAKAAANAVNPAMIAGAVRDMISGEAATNVVYQDKTTEVNIGLKVSALNSTDQIARQKITNMAGNDVTIGDVATVKQTTGPTSIQRLNQQEYVSINGKFTTQNSSGVQSEINKRVATVALPEGVSYYFEGEAKQIGEGFNNMFLAIGVSIVLVYMVMMVAFGEMLAPLAILFSLPFIFVGVILGLLSTGESLGMP